MKVFLCSFAICVLVIPSFVASFLILSVLGALVSPLYLTFFWFPMTLGATSLLSASVVCWSQNKFSLGEKL